MYDTLKAAGRRAKRTNIWASWTSTKCIQGILDEIVRIFPIFINFVSQKKAG